MNDKTTYIAREDFLNGRPRDNQNIVLDGAYIGQLALDTNEYGKKVLYCWAGEDGWLDMSVMYGNFSYCTDNDIIRAFNSIDPTEFMESIEPATWNLYEIANYCECRDEDCDVCGLHDE